MVAGHRAFLWARRAGRKRVPVVVRGDLRDEDPAFVAGVVVKDVLAGTTDPIAMGTAWAAFRKHLSKVPRPRKGYKHDRYVKRHGMSAADRLNRVIRDTFGLSDDQLRRLEAVLPLPSELHEALRAGAVPLKSLVALAALPAADDSGVVGEIRSGKPPAEAVSACLPTDKNRPAVPTALRRLLQADDQAVADLGDRVNKVGYLTDADRTRVERGRDLHVALLGLPTEGEVHGHITRILGGAPGGEEAA